MLSLYLAGLLNHARLCVLVGGIGRDKHLDCPGFNRDDANGNAAEAGAASDYRIGPSRLETEFRLFSQTLIAHKRKLEFRL